MFFEIDHDALIDALQDELALSGGVFGIRDQGLLDSALARPAQILAYQDPTPTVFQLAAAVAFGLIRNHPFLDGNKRAGFIACVMTLGINGFLLDIPDELAIDAFLGLAIGTVDEEAVADMLAKHCIEQPTC
jgi:death on curing protein